MDTECSVAKRRASFGRAARLAKEEQRKLDQQKVEQRRQTERDKADQQRKAEADKAAEQRNAQARKRAEQRRLIRRGEELRKEFSLRAEDRRAVAARAEQQRKSEATKAAEQKRQATTDQKQREAEAHVAKQEKRQLSEQRLEHIRQTHRLRVEHQAERSGFRNREAAGTVNHARQISNIDVAERRELEALGLKQRSLSGRAVGLLRGSQHYTRQEQAIVDRHENSRWQKHREHEARKDNLFWSEQASRLRQVSERHGMAKSHQAERHDLAQTQERNRPRLIEVRAQAITRANDNERRQQQEHVRPKEAFGQSAGHSQELKR